MNPSQQAAALLGERSGRSISRVIGAGLSRTVNGNISPEAATELAHAAMILGALAPKTRNWVAATLTFAYFVGR